ncbi:hypothetical protein Tco_0458155 [Tanacetum coccineum]
MRVVKSNSAKICFNKLASSVRPVIRSTGANHYESRFRPTFLITFAYCSVDTSEGDVRGLSHDVRCGPTKRSGLSHLDILAKGSFAGRDKKKGDGLLAKIQIRASLGMII